MKGAEWEQIAEWIKENQDERLELEMHLSDWEESQYGDY
jgi:NADPH-quinone oxidoreductase